MIVFFTNSFEHKSREIFLVNKKKSKKNYKQYPV